VSTLPTVPAEKLSSKFLSLELYDYEEEPISPHSLLAQLAAAAPGQVVKAYSKWFLNDGTFEWRLCEVRGFDAEEERFVIAWPSGLVKLVSRVNLRFSHEDQRKFERRLEVASELRNKAELVMRYTFMIETMSSPTTPMPRLVLEHIWRKLQGHSYEPRPYRNPLEYFALDPEDQYDCSRFLWKGLRSHFLDETEVFRALGMRSLSEYKTAFCQALPDLKLAVQGVQYSIAPARVLRLFTEVDDIFVFAQHQHEFEIDMPYSLAKLELFRPILPPQKFIPITERVKATASRGVLEGKSPNFLETLLSLDLHQRWLEHLRILVKLKSQLIEFEQSNLFTVIYLRTSDLSNLIRKHKMETINCVRELRNVMFDSQYEIQDIVNSANQARDARNQLRLHAKAYDNQSINLEEFLDADLVARLKRLMGVSNYWMELALRDCLERSLETLTTQMEQILDLAKLALFRETDLDGALTVEEVEAILYYAPLTKRSRSRPAVLAELKMGDGHFLLDPSPLEYSQLIEEAVQHALTELQVVSCLEVTDIGNARPDTGYLQVLDQVADRTAAQVIRLKKVLGEIAVLPSSFIEALEPFKFVIGMRPKRLRSNLAKDFKPGEVGEELAQLEEARAGLSRLLYKDDYLMCGVFKIDISKCKQTLLSRIEEAVTRLLDLMQTKARDSIELVEQQEQEVLSIIGHEPKHLEELDAMRTFMYTSMEERLDFVKGQVGFVFNVLHTLERLQVKAPEEIIGRAWLGYGMQKRALRARVTCERVLKKSSSAFAEELHRGTAVMLDEVESLWEEMGKLRLEDTMSQFEEVSMLYGVMKARLETASKDAKLINSREALVGSRPTDFKRLDALRREFAPYCKLWFFVRDFHYHLPRWMRGPMHDLDREAITEEVTTYLSEINVMERGQLKHDAASLKVARELRAEVSKFKPYLPIIYSLRNPGLRDRHWEELKEKTKIKLVKNLPMPLEDLLAEGIEGFQDLIEEVSDKATRQLALEQAKLKMEREWDDVEFTLVSYKSSGTWVLADNEAIWELLSDHLLKTFSMSNSPFVKFMEREVSYWKNSLVKVQEILEEWELLQKSWQYLNPILTQDDIIKQLPTASNRFKQVNELWIALMTATYSHPPVLEACLNYPKLLEQLRYANETLEQIKKSLDDFLNSKREAFPRFYFLANEELLAILSKSTELPLVQKYIFKCFEGVSTLILDFPRITGLNSFEGESVMFRSPVDFYQPDSDIPRNVEDWLKDVERTMYLTMRQLLVACSEDAKTTPRLEWLLKWPSQLVHSVNLAIWTSHTSQAIEDGELRALWSTDEKSLNSLVDVVRQESVPLSRKTLGTAVILDVHKQDILQSLIEARVKHSSDFEWQAQLRYYVSPPEMTVQMIDSVRDYGFEYLGNQDRLVITPLTDRCYRTLMGALKLNLGGAPEGPAGTGKTETTKDLAKSLAKKCVVFNCSDQLDQGSMAKFFTGLASSGAWVCFDEFNRIELEVLSVIAEQIHTIQAAVLKKARNFTFEGSVIPLDSSCAIFITMNPDYVGRSILPDNLKALFRPVAMMIPDYSMIAEISLYSYGFKEARVLAVKLINSLRLASEQLSTQKHYDYGMRTVTTIVKAAGQLKRLSLEADETGLVLRAINDCNIPKFLAADIELFQGITSDLFPGVSTLGSYSAELMSKIKEQTLSMNLVPKPEFLSKVLQLHDTIQVRHGLMLVGSAMAGKSTIFEVLAKAIAALYSSAPELMSSYTNSERFFGRKVSRRIVNPKSVTLKQLYGDSDPVSKDWMDGVLSHCIREFSEESSDCPKWIVLDGPVDAVWIENLNTVLDDNKKLCLPSGEIIKLTSSMTLLFEVDDLSAASPATVSRCGMIYVNRAEVLDWRAVFDLWLSGMPSEYSPHADYLRSVCSALLEPALRAVEEVQQVQIKTSSPWLVRSFVNLLESLMLRHKTRVEAEQDFKIFQEKEEQRRAKEAAKAASSLRYDDPRVVLPEPAAPERDVRKDLFCWSYFALTWALGGVLPEASKPAFELVVRGAATSRPERTQIGELNAFDMHYDWETQEWQEWRVSEVTASTLTDLSRLFVPTVDTERYSTLLRTLLPKGFNSLVVGPTGTGKTAISKRFLAELNAAKHISVSTSLSARASSSQTQDLVESKLMKRMKGVYGPESGKVCLVFVDDLSMPNKEEYGAQPSLEVLRQTVGRKELYERKTCELRHIEDLTFLAAMTTRQTVSERLLRHFNLLCISEFSQDILKTIFTSILTQGFNDYSQGVYDSVPVLTKATLSVYHEVVELFPPTPLKSHYTFNLRDLSSVFRGLISVPAHRMTSVEVLQRLWLHECQRVFSDRLTSDADRELLEKQLEEHLSKFFGVRRRELLGSKPLLFCNFTEERAYQEVEQYDQLKETLDQALYEYNGTAAHRMELVLFDFAIQHVCRITRIISSTYGNALLVGVGGSGRQSLSLLSAYLLEFSVFQVSMTKTYGLADWQEDLRGLLKRAGLEEEKLVLLLKDADIKSEVFLENVNNILNSGEVPNLFSKEDKDVIVESFSRSKALSFKSSAERWDLFVETCRKNLHTILCMSPIGEKLRVRIRQFPSLVSCCTIDWFTQWPREALESTSRRFLEEHELVEAEKAEVAVQVCVHFHESVAVSAQRYLQELRRSYYVTPTHYLQLLQNIKAMRVYKQETSVRLRDKFQRGVDKLNSTQLYVEQLRREQIALEPVLVRKTKETEDIMKVIVKETADADHTRSVVATEQQESAVQADHAEQIKNECKRALESAEPQLKAAMSALGTLKRPELNIVRTMQKPPLAIKLVLEAVAIINRQAPVRVQDPEDRSQVRMDYFEAGKKMMNNPKFIKKLLKFDYDTLDRPLIERIRPYIEDEKFQPAAVKTASGAAEGLCKWVIALYNYFFVKEDIGPKQAALAQATEELAAKSKLLQEKQDELERIEKTIAEKKTQYDQANSERQQLAEDIHLCQTKLERAERLTDKLGGERVRWEGQVESLSTDMKNLLGDVMLAAASVSYFGPFVSQYREGLSADWLKFVGETSHIPCNPEFSLRSSLSDSLQVQEWVIQGLPSDKVSIENAIILSRSSRWPLIIDPQKQASKWLKKTMFSEGVQITAIKASTDDLMSILENALFIGSTLMIENVGEDLDPVLEPILLKQIVVKEGLKLVKLGDSLKQYDDRFKLFLFSNLSNPHYTPETTTKVTLLNFTITKEGLTEQLLSIVCLKEMTKETDERRRLTVQSAEYVKRMRVFEDSILQMMEKAGTEMLEDEAMINSLTESKQMSEEAERRLINARKTETIISNSQKTYEPVAKEAALLYFAVTDLAAVQSMYQFSLEWFNQLFKRSIEEGEFAKELDLRLLDIAENFRGVLFKNINMSLFERDKLLFAFIVALRIYISRLPPDQHDTQATYRRFLLTGRGYGADEVLHEVNPADAYEGKQWSEICDLTSLPGFSSLRAHCSDNIPQWKAFCDRSQNFETDSEFNELTSSLPSPFNDPESYQPLQRLLIIRALRPEDLVPAIQAFIKLVLGPNYSSKDVTDFRLALHEADCFQPIVFILSAGNDPQLTLKKFGEEQKKTLYTVSLGKGQGDRAARMVRDTAQAGSWVLLQNCHLAKSWLPSLEGLVERLRYEHDKGLIKVNPEFRLLLTSIPSPYFPVALLQDSFKVTTEPAKGLKKSLTEIYSVLKNSKEDFALYSHSDKPQEWRKLFFSLAFFHCLVRERRKFGALGWNIPYEFNDSDFKISMRQLHLMLDNNEKPPFKALTYLTGECNYGGRVTDDWDRRTLLAILQTCYNEGALYDHYRFCKLPQYYAPRDSSEISSYLEFIGKLPSEESPEVFGLHDNANINYARKEAFEMFEKLLAVNPMGSVKSSLDAQKDELDTLIRELMHSLPNSFDMEAIQGRYPLDYSQSLNVVLQQEATRYNTLLDVVKNSLTRLSDAMAGAAPLTPDLEGLAENLLQNRLPKVWASVSYPSCKPLLSWVKDLVARVSFIEQWVVKGAPAVFWLSGFYFTQSFLTGVRQNSARKHHIPIDQLALKFTVVGGEPATPPEEGCYVSGLYLQGARWNADARHLDEPLPKELFSVLPVLWIEPAEMRVESARSSAGSVGVYPCPVYKTSSRAGSLSTTGHSTNYVLTVTLPTLQDEKHWVRRGVALLTQLDD
jgi:dynein heavy chain